MITNQPCWFYEQTANNVELFTGAYKPHLLWLTVDATILIFFVEKGIPKTIQYDCLQNTFEKLKPLDFSLLNTPTFDFHVQKVFFFQNRLLVVKNTLQNDKHLLLLSNNNFSKLYPIKIDIPCDFLHNGVAILDSNLFFFGGIVWESLKCHARFFKLDICTLLFNEIVLPLSTFQPLSRCNPFLEIHNNEIFMAGGYAQFPFYEGWKTGEDVWFFNLKTLIWKDFNLNSVKLTNIKNVARDRDKICILHKPKNYEVHLIQMDHFRTNLKCFTNPVWIPPGVSL